MSAAARGGTFIRFRAGTVGASARHVGYITRERAVLEEEHGILLCNLPDRIGTGRDYAELRDNLVAHASVREKLEIDRHQSRGEPRTGNSPSSCSGPLPAWHRTRSGNWRSGSRHPTGNFRRVQCRRLKG